MKLLKLIAISFLITLFWGVCFIDVEADKISSLLGFLLTGLILLFTDLHRLEKKKKIILLILPLLYVLLTNFMFNDIEKIIYNPPNAVFLLFTIGLFRPDPKKDVILQLSFCILAVGYSYTFLPKFQGSQNRPAAQLSLAQNQSVNLSALLFYNAKDEIISADSDKTKLILTWNRTCVPCKRAIKDLKDYFRENPAMDFYLVNTPFEENDFDENEIRSLVGNSDNIFILNDKDRRLEEYLNLYSAPTFLLLDGKNRLLFSKTGYRSSQKWALIEQINLSLNSDRN